MTNAKRSLISMVIVLIVTVLGLAFSWFAGTGGAQWNGYPVLYLCALVAFAVNWLAYIPSALARTEKYYDFVGSLTYLAVITTAVILSGPLEIKAIIAAVMVAIWCIRLGSFLFIRIQQSGHDSRFDQIKVNPARFLVAWSLQALWAIFTAAAALAIITAADRGTLDLFFWIGTLVWAGGFAIETIADRQKHAFRKNPGNTGRFIQSGLWAWSQHPNYFGEIMLWTGITIIALPLLSGWGWLVLLSPIFVTLLLTKVSGIPLLDKSAKNRWGDDPAYQEYRRKTPILVPRPPRQPSHRA
ncbi:DUF1295 domain-containing protein [Pontixanthobacter sp.]|uniref:DUF1295 domain-containing protein n=1 Tax=Pontixanthobacter sp. TaxID=2792078 RepID=UPI003C7E3B8B